MDVHGEGKRTIMISLWLVLDSYELQMWGDPPLAVAITVNDTGDNMKFSMFF